MWFRTTTGDRVTTHLYDVRAMPQKTTYHDEKFEEFVYSVRGDLESQKDRRGNTTSFQFNNRRQLTKTTQPGNRITTQTYDNSSNLETITDPVGNVTRLTYSATGKTLTQTIAYGTADAATTTHVYDKRDWLDYTLDPLQHKTDFGYDAAGRMTSSKNHLNHETLYQYDANGNRTQIRTPLGHETDFTYTALNTVSTMTDAADEVVTYGYNDFGERTSLKNRRDHTFSFDHDANGNPTTTETPLDHTVTTTWNDRNLVGSIEKDSGQTTTFVYDHVRRVGSQTDSVGTISFGYDDNGNPLTVTEGSAVLTRTWDALNRPESYTNARSQAIGYEYYDNGLLWKITYPGDRTVTYTYYPTNRLKTVTDWASRVTTYTWDDAGRLTGITRPNGVSRVNVFDNANRPTHIHERDSAQKPLVYFNFGYDNDSRLTSSYHLPSPPAVALPVHSATFDADNRLETWNSQSITHDDDGNMTHGPLFAMGLTSYSYDARNRLTSVGGVSYGYDAEDNRISMTTTSGTTQYLIDPHGGALPRVLVREKPDTSTTTYVYGIGLLYEVDDATGTATYYHFDHIGNTVALSDASGTLTDRIDYGPYGQVTYRAGNTDTPFLYVGQLGVQTDPNGLLHMRARYYSPELKRFVNADPIGFAGGMNWYAYANGNPVMYVDPSGNITVLSGLIGGAIGAVAGAAGQFAVDVVNVTFNDGEFSSASTYAGAITGGATTGAVLGTTFNPYLAGAAGSAVGNATTQAIDVATGNRDNFSVGELAFGTTVGAATGFIPGPKVSPFNSGRNSFTAIAKSTQTKLANGTIQNVSLKTSAKIAVGQTFDKALFQGSLIGSAAGFIPGAFDQGSIFYSEFSSGIK